MMDKSRDCNDPMMTGGKERVLSHTFSGFHEKVLMTVAINV